MASRIPSVIRWSTSITYADGNGIHWNTIIIDSVRIVLASQFSANWFSYDDNHFSCHHYFGMEA